MNTFLESASSLLPEVAALSCKGALLALFVGAAVRLMRKQVSPAWRHALWLLVLARLVVPDVATSSWSMSRWLDVPRSVAPPAIFTMESVSTEPEPFSAESTDLQTDEIDAPVPSAETQIITTAPVLHRAAWTSRQWLAFAWLLGAGCVLGIMAVLHWRMRARVRCDGTAPPPDARAALREACALAGVKRAPDLIITDAVRAPALFGIVRPAILLPRDFAAACDPAALRLILLHELAHLRRRDLCTQVAASLIIALHWFNPLVWWAGRRMRAEAEMAADARVLRWTSTQEAHRMGGVLLAFAHQAAASWVVGIASATLLGIAENKRDLRLRIEALTDLARGRRTWWLMGLAAYVALSVTGLTKAPADDAKKNPAEEVRKAVPLAAETKAVTGIVIDDEGRPIPGATCHLMIETGKGLSGIGTATDEEGCFRFEASPDGTGFIMSGRRGEHVEKTGTLTEGTELKLSARHPDYLEMTPPVPVFKCGEWKEHRITLSKPDAWLSGMVTRKEDGMPVVNATVYAGPDTLMDSHRDLMLRIFVNSTARVARTDAAGRYRIPNWSLKPKKGLMVIDAPGAALLVERFSWESGDLTLDQTLEAGPGVKGRVVNAEGQPVADVEVVLEKRFSHLMDRSPARAAGINRDVADEHSIGLRLTGRNGEFERKLFDNADTRQLWLTARHPSEGYRRVRLRDWKSGNTLKLDRWSAIHGKLLDVEGNAVRGAEVKLMQHEMERDETGSSAFSVSKTTSCKTDEQGRYKLEQILPGSGNSFVIVDGKSLPMRLGPHLPGETAEVTLRLRPQTAEVPADQLRKVTGRVVMPEGHRIISDQYETRVNIGLAGNVGSNRLDAPLADGRFASKPLAAGDYILRIWAEPKDRKLAADFDRGISLPFKLAPDAGQQPLELGEFKLEAKDFVFRAASSTPSERSARRTQHLNAPVADAASFATWAGSSGRGVGPEKPLTPEGRIAGDSAVSSDQRFMIRATKPDGTRQYSAALLCTEDAEATFEHRLSFSPGVAVEGRVRDLPADYPGGGWVVAAVRVNATVEQGAVMRGGIPSLTWHAWAPVQRGGRFRFASLPRGSLSLVGFGDGWVTRDAFNFGAEVSANLMGSETVIKVDADAKPTLKHRVCLLLPDGSPAAGATITVAPNATPIRHQLFVIRGHAHELEDAEAYQRYKERSIPGHNAVADAEGHATLGNQLYQPYGTTACEVKWTDPKTKAAHVEIVDIKIGSAAPQVVKLTGKAG